MATNDKRFTTRLVAEGVGIGIGLLPLVTVRLRIKEGTSIRVLPKLAIRMSGCT